MENSRPVRSSNADADELSPVRSIRNVFLEHGTANEVKHRNGFLASMETST